jgi:hypothetical protein
MDLRQKANKPAYWPDKLQGDTYVVTLNEGELEIMRNMRFEATRSSILMISAMEVNWVDFGFDQLGSMASLAIDLGHTNYGGDWASAESNKTNLGQQESATAAKIFDICLSKAAEDLTEDPRVEFALKSVNMSIGIALGVVKYYLFKEGVMAKVVPLLGPLKEAVDSIGKGSVSLRLGHKSLQRAAAAKTMIDRGSTAAQALESFESLIKIESTKAAVELAYKLLKDTALVVLNVLASGALTVVQVVTSIVEVVVDFVYQLVYCIVFQMSVEKCREWVQAGASPQDLDFRAWSADCPLLGAHFMVGLAAGGGATTALSMFSQQGVPVSSTDFQGAAVKLQRARQAAAAYIDRSPVKVKWSGDAAKTYAWIDGLVKNEAKSASVGANFTKIHKYSLSDDASSTDRLRHKFYENGNKVWSIGKRPGPPYEVPFLTLLPARTQRNRNNKRVRETQARCDMAPIEVLIHARK